MSQAPRPSSGRVAARVVLALLSLGAAPVVAQVDVDFTASPTTGTNPLAVTFADASSGSVSWGGWIWSFGDGTFGIGPGPTHTYTSPGSYTVSLTVSFAGGPATETKVDLIVVDPAAPVAGFTASATHGVNPFSVDFTDTSTGGTFTDWSWDFGDGNGESGQDPTHVFTLPGTYTVSLTASIGSQSDTAVMTDFITVDPAPLLADFTASTTQGVNPLPISFTDTSTGSPPTAWSWDFGDGGSSSEQHPTHTYTLPGTYSVALTAFVGQQGDTLVQTGLVTVDPALLVASFGASTTRASNPVAIDFTDTSTGSPLTAWSWDFGDGGSSTEQHPTHVYAAPGTYSVSLTAFIGQQGDTHTAVDLVTVTPGTFAAPREVAGWGDRSPSVFAVDLDGDGDADLLAPRRDAGAISWSENLDGLGGFGPPLDITTETFDARSAHAADLDQDGDADVLSASYGDDKLAFYENTDGLGGFGPQQVITAVLQRPRVVLGSDLDGDGVADALYASGTFDQKLAWCRNTDGLGSFGPPQVFSPPADNPTATHAADLDGDGDLDVLSASSSDDRVTWYRNTDGLGSFGPMQVITTSTNGANSVFAADLDGDGSLDVLSSSTFDARVAWYENLGLGVFGPQQVISDATASPRAVHAADMDEDGDVDVLAAGGGSTITWFENVDGLGSFEAELVSLTSVSPTALFAADLDGDGALDVVSSSSVAAPLAWSQNQARWFDLGGGAPSGGAPVLAMGGPLTPSTLLTLDLVDGRPLSLAIVFVAFTSTPAAFLGGTLHAFPIGELVVVGTDAAGEIHGAVLFPGAAHGQELWFQVGIEDAGVPVFGASLSNAVKGIVP